MFSTEANTHNMTEPKIIFEDASIIVVDKPSGISVHSDGRSTAPTLVDWLIARFPEIKDIGETQKLQDGSVIARPGIVHRLDRDTSGVVVVARTQPAYVRLKKQFARHEIQKTYRAFVYGAVKDDRGIIDKPLGRAQGSGSRRSVRNPHGVLREAQTAFRTISRTRPGTPAMETASYLEVFPKTGRTHQIRVHLAFIHHPVVCDKLYGPKLPPVLGFERLALHALSLSFTHPGTGKPVVFSAPLPDDFVEAERQISK